MQALYTKESEIHNLTGKAEIVEELPGVQRVGPSNTRLKKGKAQS